MSKGHWRLVFVLGVVSVWFAFTGPHFRWGAMILGLIEIFLGWFVTKYWGTEVPK